MVMSVIGFLYQPEESNVYKYNNNKFYKTESGWLLKKDNQQYLFNYKVEELENIIIPYFNLNVKKVYILFDPLEMDNNIEYNINKLRFVLANVNIISILACIKEENCPDIPIKKCNDPDTMIYFKNGNITKSYIDSNCLVLEGDAVSIGKEVDKLNLHLLNII